MRNSCTKIAAVLALLVLVLGTATSTYAHSSFGPGPSPATPQVFKALLGVNWAQADFDGDNLPDLAQGQKLGRGTNGYLYRISLALSRNAAQVSFTFTDAEAMNLRVDAVDVDGDNDLDLVVSGRFGHKIGVWINNGKGNFEREPAEHYPAAFSVHTFQAAHWSSLSSYAIDNGSRRHSFMPAASVRLEFDSPAAGSVNELEKAIGARRSSSIARLRAPPQQV